MKIISLPMNITFFIVPIVALLLAAVGWLMNVLAIVHLVAQNAPVTTLFVARIAGLFIPPLGVILVWFA